MTEFLDDNTKPEWEDAPEWANWLACDPDGLWYWYQDEPRCNNVLEEWDDKNGSLLEMHYPQDDPQPCEEWRSTLEQKPNMID